MDTFPTPKREGNSNNLFTNSTLILKITLSH